MLATALFRFVLLFVLSISLSLVQRSASSPVTKEDEAKFLLGRALGNIRARANPSGSYTPSSAACPARPSGNGYTGFIRSAANNGLNPNEMAYISSHQRATQQGWQDWLSSASPGPNLNDGQGGIAGGVQNYTSDISRLPRVGIALSGGGYRAMVNGAGFLQGLDSRNSTAQRRGTAGLLQLSLYTAGLSGGSWAVGTLALNDWPQAQTLLEQTWDLESNLVIPEDGKVGFYADIVADVAGKRISGYPTGIVDYWGRALSYHLVNSSYPDEGQGTTFGDIRNTTAFQQATYPLPIVIADEREPGQLLIYRNTTIFEFSPFEFGSYDPDVQAFVPIDILGTTLANGASAQDGNECTYGFDNFGWVVGTSSTLFNQALVMLVQSDGDSVIKDAVQSILGEVAQQQNDVSVLPNPFRGFTENPNSSVSDLTQITLVDGGEDNQNIPVNTLLIPERQLDLLIAVDNSGDVTDWPNGTALHETFLRYQSQSQYNAIAMPVIPAPTTFVNRGLNTRPTLFGCNLTDESIINLNSAPNGTPPPIIAYVPNYPYLSLSNTSTFKLEYSQADAQALLDNGVDVATLGGRPVNNANLEWSTCLACAALERGFLRSNTARPQVCTQCLQTFCWDGVTNDTMSSQAYSPPVGAPEFVTSGGSVQQAAAYTGGNGSNSDQGITSSGTNGAEMLHHPSMYSSLLLGSAILVLTIAFSTAA